jgi:NAD(P)-dependent dehydrogenase (short-subunit alcohol dehydrogenase family)
MRRTEDVGTALVTGAARRIGRAIAEALAQRGYGVALHASARSRGEAEALAAAITAAGGRACVLVADLARPEEVERLVPQAAAALGPVTLLVNNASAFEADAPRDFDLARFEAHVATNLRAPLQLASAFVRQLADKADGAIINIIDQRVWRLNPHFFSYTLSKSALWTATQTMAQAFAPHVRVNAVGPGPTLANHMQRSEDFAREASATPLQRPIDPAEIAAAVIYLVEARSVTGQMIAVDGGQHLAWKTPDVEP